MSTVFWLPYLKLVETKNVDLGDGGGTIVGAKVDVPNLVIGQANVVPDTPESWANFFSKDRPMYLDMFREEPNNSLDNGRPAIGTLVLAKNSDWLESHIGAVVAILYFLGDSNRTLTPAEQFSFHRLDLKSKTDDFIFLPNKFGGSGEGVFDEIGERVSSLAIYPPLSIRGVDRTYSIDLARRSNKALIRRFARSEKDRIAVSARQYFRAQFGDLFTSDYQNDFALYCAATEAALDLPEDQASGEGFVKDLVKRFKAKNLEPREQELRMMFLGWYCARSLHVHGGAGGKSKKAERQKAFEYFQKLRFKTTLLREITRETILYNLDSTNVIDNANSTVEMTLSSTVYWRQLKKLLDGSCAAKKINSLDWNQYAPIFEIAKILQQKFHWACVTPTPNSKVIHSMLVTCAIVLGSLTNSTGKTYELSDRLGNAASKRDPEGVLDWLIRAASWKYKDDNTELGAIQCITWKVAEYFRVCRTA